MHFIESVLYCPVAVKDIRNRMAEKMQFYCLGSVSSLDDATTVSLTNELETFQPKPPDVNPQKSTKGKYFCNKQIRDSYIRSTK